MKVTDKMVQDAVGVLRRSGLLDQESSADYEIVRRMLLVAIACG